jgi:hypothetical protein
VRLEDAPGLTPELAALLDDIVEVAPGVKKRRGDCTIDEVAGSLEAAHETRLNAQEIGELLRRAIDEGIHIPPDVFERNPTATADGPGLIALRDELRALVDAGQGDV